MTTNDDERPSDDSSTDTAQVLYVVEGYGGFHLVSPATLAAAAEAQRATEASPHFENFGDLRRAGDLPHLIERLQAWSLSVENYVEAIENSCGRDREARDLAERLAAVHDVEFAGSDDANAPSDDTDFRSDSELENEVEDPYLHVLETGMCSDVPADVLEAFNAVEAPMFVDYRTASVQEDRLDEMVSVLEGRGYRVLRD